MIKFVVEFEGWRSAGETGSVEGEIRPVVGTIPDDLEML